MGEDLRVEFQLLQHLIIALKDFDGVPSLLLLGQTMNSGFLNVRDCMLHATGETVHRNGFGLLCRFDGFLGGNFDARAFQSGDFHDPAAQLAGKFADVNLVAVLADHVNHIDCNHNRNPEFGQLRGEVEVSFQVGTVDDVQNRVGALGDEVISCHNFFERVGGEGVDAGEVRDDDIIVSLEFSLFLFDRNAGPVTDKLIGAGQRVEQGRLTGIGVTGKCNADIVFHFTFFLSY